MIDTPRKKTNSIELASATLDNRLSNVQPQIVFSAYSHHLSSPLPNRTASPFK